MKWLHILAGLAGLVSGAVALYSFKGGPRHRRSGMIFVYTMLFMSGSGALMAALKMGRISVVAGVLTFYLVATGLLTVRRPVGASRWIDATALLVASSLVVACATLVLGAVSSGTGRIDGLPIGPLVMFGAVALLAALGDLRVLLARGIEGPRRLARHLWRMCFALFIATASFFLGQPQIFPKWLHRSGLLPLPVLAVLATMLFWLVRVSFKRRPVVSPRASRVTA